MLLKATRICQKQCLSMLLAAGNNLLFSFICRFVTYKKTFRLARKQAKASKAELERERERAYVFERATIACETSCTLYPRSRPPPTPRSSSSCCFHAHNKCMSSSSGHKPFFGTKKSKLWQLLHAFETWAFKTAHVVVFHYGGSESKIEKVLFLGRPYMQSSE